MDENLFQNNPEFISLSKFFAKITKNSQTIEYLNNDEVNKLRSLVDRAISKLKKIYNISSHFSDILVLEGGDETENEYQISTISIFSLISQSLYILSKQKPTISSDDELIVSLQSRNEQLEEENHQLKSRIDDLSLMNEGSDEYQIYPEDPNKYIGSSEGTMDNDVGYDNANNNNANENQKNYKKANNNSKIILQICNKLKLSKKTSNENELVNILTKEINKSKKIKQEINRHYNLNINNPKETKLSVLIQTLDKHIKHEVESHNNLKSELTEATEDLTQLQKELEYITKSIARKDSKINQLRTERNEARQQLSELLETIKKNNYTSRSMINDEDRSDHILPLHDEQREAEIEELTNELQKAQDKIRKKKAKIQKLKQKIETLEENKLTASINHQAKMLSSIANGIENMENSLNKSQTKLKSISFPNENEINDDEFLENDENAFELKKKLINMKDLLNQKEDQLTSLKSFVSNIATQYENTSNELCEESRNKCELARSVQLLLDANQILEKLLESSNQQKDELKHQLDNSIFKAQNNNGATGNGLTEEMSEFRKKSDQFLLQKMKKLTDEAFSDDDDEITAKLNKVFINENRQSDSELVLEVCKSILSFISSLKTKVSDIKDDLNDERKFTSHLLSACLGQLRFIMNLSDSKLMQNWILGDENEEWVRQTLQVQVAKMENFFDGYVESYTDRQNRNIDRFQTVDDSSLNPIQQIEKGIFEELLPLTKSLSIDSSANVAPKNKGSEANSNVNDALLIPLSTRVSEYLSSYKEKLVSEKMTASDKDMYVMLVQTIAANNVLQIFATEAGNQCKSQFNEIRNLQTQLSLLNRQNYPNENNNNNSNNNNNNSNNNNNNNNNNNSNNNNNNNVNNNNDNNSNNNNVDNDNNNNNNDNDDDDGVASVNDKKKRKKGLKEKNLQIKKLDNEANVYEEIKNIKKILRKGVSRMISKSRNKPNNDDSNSNNNNNNVQNNNEKQIPFSDLFLCLKCIEKADKVSFDRDKYVKKLEKQLVRLDIVLKESNNQLSSMKGKIEALQNEQKAQIEEHEKAEAKLNKQLASREKELNFLKETVMMLNYGDASAIDQIAKQNDENQENSVSSMTTATTATTVTNNEEEERQKIDIRAQYEEVVNGLRDEVDALEQKVKKINEESNKKIELIKDKAKKKQSKLLSTINFLTNQKKEIEEEQVKEREACQKAIEKIQAENSQLIQKVEELNEQISAVQDKLSKSQIENKLVKSRLKNEEEKGEREKSLLESRMKLKAFSIENTMKDKIEEARKQQQAKHRELIIYIFNLFSDEVDLLMKNSEAETEATFMSQETDDTVYSFLQNVKTKMSRLERSSFACDTAMNELNEIRRILENFIRSNSSKLSLEGFDTNSKCSRIIKEVLDSITEKVASFQNQENEYKRLKMDSSTAAKVIEKAREAAEWENWCRRIQRFITEGFETKQVIGAPAPVSPSQILCQNVNKLNLNLVAHISSAKEMRNKLEEAIYSAASGNIKAVLKKLEILRTEKIIMTQFQFNSQVRQCLFASPIAQNNRNNMMDDDDYNGHPQTASFYHLIIVSLIVIRIEKLSGHVQSFFSLRKKNPEINFNNNNIDNVDTENQNYQISKIKSPGGKATKPIFSQFISPM